MTESIPQLLNECRNCKMRFDTSHALANHVRKLEQRLQELNHNPFEKNLNFNFQEVKQYLKGDETSNHTINKAVGNMNLDDLRNYFQSEGRKLDDITKQAVRVKEKELIDELQEIKKERNFIRQNRAEQEKAMHDLIKELELKKDRELRAKIEKEEIQKSLKEIERTKTNALERDKRRELERLAAERENLRLREEEIMEEIKNLEAQSYEQERKMKEDKDRKLKVVDNSEYYGKVMRKKEIEIAKFRGEEIAQLQQKKDNLERDRQRIMEDLDKVRSGDLQGLRKNESSRWVANDIILKGGAPNSGIDITRVKLDPSVKDKLISDQVRINHLKEQREKLLRDAHPELDELDAMLQQWKMPKPADKYQTQPYPNHMARSMPARPGSGVVPVGVINGANIMGGSPYKNREPRNVSFAAGPTGMQSDLDLLDKLRQLKSDYDQSGEGDPQFYAQLSDLENHLRRKMPEFDGHSYQAPQSPSDMFQQRSHSLATGGIAPGIALPPQEAYPPAYPVNFYPPMANTIPPAYIPPPPPMLNGEQNIERFRERPEPLPQIVVPYTNPQIDVMNKMIKEQEIQNEILEKELLNIKQGGGDFSNFEMMLGGTDNDLSKLKHILGKRGKGGGGSIAEEPFPEDFVFRQNEFRCEDLEVEERALMNVAAQEYDALRLMSKLPANSELYRYKMDQYKELSTMRAEIEKVLQEQRLEKIRRDFEKQKYEDERRFKHEKWLEDQKRQILEAKLKNAARQPPPAQVKPQTAGYYPSQTPQYALFDAPKQQQEPSERNFQPQPDPFRQSYQQPNNIPPPMFDIQQQYQPPPISQKQQTPQPTPGKFMPGQQLDLGNPNEYSPDRGVNIFYDFIARLQRQFRSMRVVYAIYNVSRSIIPPTLIDIHDAEPDPEDQEKNRIIFKEFNLIKNIQPHPSSNLIIELQVPKPNTNSRDKYVSYGWTVLNLFDVHYELNRGIFKLPLYMSPTKADIDVRDIPYLKRIPETIMMMRIGNPNDENSRFEVRHLTSPDEYVIPRIHQYEPDKPLKEEDEPPVEHDENPLEEYKQALEQPPENRDYFKNNYECKGINVQLHYLKQYAPQTHARMHCTLYNGTEIVRTEDGKMCNWSSKPIDVNNIIYTQGNNPMNQGLAFTPGGLARGEVIAVEDQTTWIKDLYKLQWDHNRAQDLILVIQIMEYVKGRNFQSVHEIQTDYQPIAYGLLKVNNPDGTIRYGTYDLEFFKPPVNLKKNPAGAMKFSAKVTIAQPPFTQTKPVIPPQPQIQADPLQSQRPPRDIQVEPDRPLPSQNQLPPSKQKGERPFIPNEMKPYDDNRFMDGEGIDFYVDGGRFLPENVTYSRVLVRAFTIDQYRVINPTKGLADLEISKGRHPFFGFRQEIRAPKLDPTLTMLITVETIDRWDGLEKIVGYAYFPLFLNAQTKLPVNNRNNVSMLLQAGSYQIPLYAAKIPVEKDISIENIQALEKIPCASILIRSLKAPAKGNLILSINDVPQEQWRSEGLIVDPPDYQDGVYNTTYCNVSQFEKELFDLKFMRYNPPMRKIVEYVLVMKGKQSMGVTSDEQLIQFVDKNLQTNPQTPLINLRYFSAYDPRFGFRFAVERIHGLTQKMPHFVVTSITPPSSLYSYPVRISNDVAFFTDFNWDGPWNSLLFHEDLLNYVGLAPNIKLGFVLDVKGLKITGNKAEVIDIGWAYLPVYDILENENGSLGVYCNSGCFALPLFPGLPTAELLHQAAQSPRPIQVIRDRLGGKFVEYTTVIVRIHDNQRLWIPPKSYYADIDNSYLPQDKLQKYAFFEQREKVNDLAKKFIPSAFTKQSYRETIDAAIKIKYKVA